MGSIQFDPGSWALGTAGPSRVLAYRLLASNQPYRSGECHDGCQDSFVVDPDRMLDRGACESISCLGLDFKVPDPLASDRGDCRAQERIHAPIRQE